MYNPHRRLYLQTDNSLGFACCRNNRKKRRGKKKGKRRVHHGFGFWRHGALISLVVSQSGAKCHWYIWHIDVQMLTRMAAEQMRARARGGPAEGPRSAEGTLRPRVLVTVWVGVGGAPLLLPGVHRPRRRQWLVGICASEASRARGRVRLSTSAWSPGAGRSTSGSSRACSCWPTCLLLWKRPRRPRWAGWSGSAGRGTWSPGWGRCRAGCRPASGAS